MKIYQFLSGDIAILNRKDELKKSITFTLEIKYIIRKKCKKV
jgi:hypothetical protein